MTESPKTPFQFVYKRNGSARKSRLALCGVIEATAKGWLEGKCRRRFSPAPTSERRGLSYDDSAPVTPHNAPFPTYKAARVHHTARRRGRGVAAGGIGPAAASKAR